MARIFSDMALIFTDDWDEANEAVRLLMHDNATTIDEILEAIRKAPRPRRTWVPSQKALDSAALPSEQSDVCTDHDDLFVSF